MPTFTPPTVKQGSSDYFFGRYSIDVGRTVIRRSPGVFDTIQTPWLGELTGKVDGVDFFLGGHEYTVTDAQALELEAAGFTMAKWDLRTWFTSVLPNRAISPAKVLVLGDSIFEGVLTNTPAYQNRWIDLAQTRVRARLGNAGSAGFMPAYYADALMTDDTTRGGAAPTENSFIWGWGGKAIRMPGTTGNNATLTWPAQTCTKVRIWYGKTNFLGGNFVVKIDGNDVTNTGTLYPGGSASGTFVNCASSPNHLDGFYWESAALTDASHTVMVQSISNGVAAIVDGAEFLRNDATSGVHIYDGAHSGATAALYIASGMDPAWNGLSTLNPHVVIIGLGTNDSGSISADTFKANMLSLIAKVRIGAPTAKIVLVKGWRPGARSQSLWASFMAKLDEIAAIDSTVCTFDLAARWPVLTEDGKNNQGLMVEATLPVHPNTAGHSKYADIITDLLAPAGIV